MIDDRLTVRDTTGREVEPAALGVDQLVEMIRQRPAAVVAHLAGGSLDEHSDAERRAAVHGPAFASLEAVEALARQVAALRAACVAAVAEEVPLGAGSNRILDEVSCALAVSRRSAQRTRTHSASLRDQPEVWAALSRGLIDLTRASILALALLEIPFADADGLERPTYAGERAELLADGLAHAEDHTARRLELHLQQRLTCRTTGAVLDVGSLSYRPPAALDRHLRLRDGTCRFPGCEVPARQCDRDHLIPLPLGPTSAENLHYLCRRHHGLKHEGAWSVVAAAEQGLRWRSPQGATATTHPDDTNALIVRQALGVTPPR